MTGKQNSTIKVFVGQRFYKQVEDVAKILGQGFVLDHLLNALALRLFIVMILYNTTWCILKSKHHSSIQSVNICL